MMKKRCACMILLVVTVLLCCTACLAEEGEAAQLEASDGGGEKYTLPADLAEVQKDTEGNSQEPADEIKDRLENSPSENMEKSQSRSQRSASAEDLMAEAQRYYKGDGVPQDYKKAHDLYEDAAELGNDEAMLNLGSMYYYGTGVIQDYEKSFSWYERAAYSGNPSAMYSIAVMFENGIGVKENQDSADYWYSKAKELQ